MSEKIGDRMEPEDRSNHGVGVRNMMRRLEKHDRGFHHSDIHKAAEELRIEGKGSHDPNYENSKKNK